MNIDIDHKLKEIFANLFFLNPDSIHDKLSQDDVFNWDSMQHLNLVLAIEEEFGISITPEESTEMLNYGLVLMLIDEKMNQQTND